MFAQPMAEFSGETVRNVAGALIWWARPTERPEVLNRDWSAKPRVNPTKQAIRELTDNFCKRHDAIVAVSSNFQDLQKEVEDFQPGREIDPDDSAVPALEKGEAYFRGERAELREIRNALQRTGGTQAHGAEVFAALKCLDELFEALIASFQELRWLIMVNDGLLAPRTKGQCTSGAEFMAALENP